MEQRLLDLLREVEQILVAMGCGHMKPNTHGAQFLSHVRQELTILGKSGVQLPLS